MLAFFALLGLQFYMGVLSQICIKEYNFPPRYAEGWSSIDDNLYRAHFSNESNWLIHEELGTLIMCGNSTGAGKCPEGSLCMGVSEILN